MVVDAHGSAWQDSAVREAEEQAGDKSHSEAMSTVVLVGAGASVDAGLLRLASFIRGWPSSSDPCTETLLSLSSVRRLKSTSSGCSE
jgi:NAD-dependent SIR2 family protein deacetylase